MSRIEAASPKPKRQVIDAQHLLAVPDSEPNPHLWYSPRTMPAVARRRSQGARSPQPPPPGLLRTPNSGAFDGLAHPWYGRSASFTVPTPAPAWPPPEPVARLHASRRPAPAFLTPLSLQLDIMNGVDPAPQNVSHPGHPPQHHQVKAFLYNRQVTDSRHLSPFLHLAGNAHIPVVGSYETNASGGMTTSSGCWLKPERCRPAVADGRSTGPCEPHPRPRTRDACPRPPRPRSCPSAISTSAWVGVRSCPT